jgi:hypothetical protein
MTLKLAENIESDKLESKIDELMESVINTFNAGFSKKEITQAVETKETKEKEEQIKNITHSSEKE